MIGEQLHDGVPHFQHIRGWGVVVLLLVWSSPVTGSNQDTLQ